MVNQMAERRVPCARRAAAVCMVVVVFLAPACGGSTIPTATAPIGDPPVSRTPPPPVPGSAGSCEPGSPQVEVPAGVEIEAITERGKPAYALFATDTIEPLTPIAVWWRIPGDGRFRVTLVSSDGRIESADSMRPGLLEGWERPGEPWVGQIVFPSAGCWRVYFVRGRDRGDLWVDVA
jgi:hypothetical protein